MRGVSLLAGTRDDGHCDGLRTPNHPRCPLLVSPPPPRPFASIRPFSSSSSAPPISALTRFAREAVANFRDGVSFYLDGAKALISRARDARVLRDRLDRGGLASLSWREYQVMKQSEEDVRRCLPFTLFVVIPFSGWFLPLVVKMFPNVLPSPFWDESTTASVMAKRAEERLRIAKQLELDLNTRLMSVSPRSPWYDVVSRGGADELQRLLELTHGGQRRVTLQDLSRAKLLFNTVFNLGQLRTSSLQMLAKYYGRWHALPLEAYVVNGLYHHIDRMVEDDALLSRHAETHGLDDLSTPELQRACELRGFRGDTRHRSELIASLSEWLSISSNASSLSSSLLLFMPVFSTSSGGGARDGDLPVAPSHPQRDLLPYEAAMDLMLPRAKIAADRFSRWKASRDREAELRYDASSYSSIAPDGAVGLASGGNPLVVTAWPHEARRVARQLGQAAKELAHEAERISSQPAGWEIWSTRNDGAKPKWRGDGKEESHHSNGLCVDDVKTRDDDHQLMVGGKEDDIVHRTMEDEKKGENGILMMEDEEKHENDIGVMEDERKQENVVVMMEKQRKEETVKGESSSEEIAHMENALDVARVDVGVDDAIVEDQTKHCTSVEDAVLHILNTSSEKGLCHLRSIGPRRSEKIAKARGRGKKRTSFTCLEDVVARNALSKKELEMVLKKNADLAKSG